jgi:hypothetical protein
VTYRQNWGEQRVYFHDDQGRLISLPAAWTSLWPTDPVVDISAGRSAFRVEDLLELANLVEWIQREPRGKDEGQKRKKC